MRGKDNYEINLEKWRRQRAKLRTLLETIDSERNLIFDKTDLKPVPLK